MKTKLIQIKGIKSCSVEAEDGFFGDPPKFKVEIKTEKFPGDPKGLKIFREAPVAETLKEFREIHGLTKEKLVEWLNKNYGKSNE
jgi:hypothetical protein